MLRQRVVLGRLVELAGKNGWRVMLKPVQHAGLQCRVDFTERQRRGGSAHQAQTLGNNGVRQGSDLEASQIFGTFHRLLGQNAARTEIIGPRDDPDIGTLEQSLLDRLGSTGIKGFGLLRKTGEEIAEVEGPDQRHQIGRDRGARYHQVDHPQLDGIDDIDFLTQLVVGEEGDVDLFAEAVDLEVLDQAVVVDAAVGIFGIVGKRRRTFEFRRGGLRAPDDRGRQDQPGSGRL